MREAIEKAAARNRRTMTAEIIARLQSTFDQEQGTEPADLKGLTDGIDNLRAQIRALQTKVQLLESLRSKVSELEELVYDRLASQ